MVVGVRYAVQMDQAGGVALRRHAAGPGHLVARPHQGRRAASARSSTMSSTSCRRSSRPPASRHPTTVDGITQRPIEGVSMAYTFDEANAKAPSKRDTQYFEMAGNRAIYHDGWIANTTPFAPPWDLATGKLPDVVDGYKWELYNITEDFSQNNDLAAKNAREAEGNAGAVPDARRRNTTSCRWTTRPSRACSRRDRARSPGARCSPTAGGMPGSRSAMRPAFWTGTTRSPPK